LLVCDPIQRQHKPKKHIGVFLLRRNYAPNLEL
jgi:hypothetical protein